jgi:hypothetical protein
MKLGKKPARHDPRTLQARKYLLAPAGALPAAKPACDWLSAVPSFPLYGNDVHGDCAIAAIGHMLQVWSANVAADGGGNAGQGAVTPSEDEILRVYQILSPKDDGCVLLDVLKYWRQNPICGVQLGAFAKVNPRDMNEVKVCLEIFGGLYGGAQLPVAAQTQELWELPTDEGRAPIGDNHQSSIVNRQSNPFAPGSWGGHAIPFGKYDASLIRCVTWGAVKDATWPWLLEYVDELYALISPDWLDGTGKTPEGLDLATLGSDLKLVTGD